jgi:hypothetical protein
MADSFRARVAGETPVSLEGESGFSGLSLDKYDRKSKMSDVVISRINSISMLRMSMISRSVFIGISFRISFMNRRNIRKSRAYSAIVSWD